MNWLSVQQVLPEYGKPVIVTDGVDVHVLSLYCVYQYATYTEYEFNDENGSSYLKATHWMPLPELPKINNNEH